MNTDEGNIALSLTKKTSLIKSIGEGDAFANRRMPPAWLGLRIPRPGEIPLKDEKPAARLAKQSKQPTTVGLITKHFVFLFLQVGFLIISCLLPVFTL